MAVFDRLIIVRILWFATIVVGVFGLCIGSFLNVVVWRLPRGESLNHPGSRCPKCGHAILPWENIPVLSWLVLRGKCSQCSLPISIRYPIVETSNAVICLLLWWRLWTTGLPLSLMVGWMFLGSALFAVAMIDIEHLLIPNKITYSGMVAALLLAFFFPETHQIFEIGRFGALAISGALGLSESFSGFLNGNPRFFSLFDSLFGLLFGYGVLRAVLEVGKLVLGKKKYHKETSFPLLLTRGTLKIGDDLAKSMKALLVRKYDRVLVKVAGLQVEFEDGHCEDFDESEVIAKADCVCLGQKEIPWENIREIRGKTDCWTLPREALGFGDPKLLGMLGAFLGADACLFILTFASLGGVLVGIGCYVFAPKLRNRPLPFGPFLALATFLWLFAGSELVNAYLKLLYQFNFHSATGI